MLQRCAASGSGSGNGSRPIAAVLFSRSAPPPEWPHRTPPTRPTHVAGMLQPLGLLCLPTMSMITGWVVTVTASSLVWRSEGGAC